MLLFILLEEQSHTEDDSWWKLESSSSEYLQIKITVCSDQGSNSTGVSDHTTFKAYLLSWRKS